MISTTHPDSASILAALPLRPRPELYVEDAIDESGHLLILESATPEALEEGDDSEVIIGLAVHDENGWYLGCVTCKQEIAEEDSGMCAGCRSDAAFDQQFYAED